MSCISVSKILIPNKGVDLYKWLVIVCDQYASQPNISNHLVRFCLYKLLNLHDYRWNRLSRYTKTFFSL